MNTTTIRLTSGYDKRRNPPSKLYRPMSVAEAKQLHSGQRVPFLAADGTAREVKVNGQPKTWKRDASRVEVPVKYGIYEHARFENLGCGTVGNHSGAILLVELAEENS